jgi:hypothetical protein
MKYKEVYDALQTNLDMYSTMANAASYMHKTLPFAEITGNTFALKKIEAKFKSRVEFMVDSEVFALQMNEEQKNQLKEYLSNDLAYFTDNMYLNEQVDMLFVAIAVFYQVSVDMHYKSKRSLLIFQASLNDWAVI